MSELEVGESFGEVARCFLACCGFAAVLSFGADYHAVGCFASGDEQTDFVWQQCVCHCRILFEKQHTASQRIRYAVACDIELQVVKQSFELTFKS